jgi:hypothetical protein
MAGKLALHPRARSHAGEMLAKLGDSFAKQKEAALAALDEYIGVLGLLNPADDDLVGKIRACCVLAREDLDRLNLEAIVAGGDIAQARARLDQVQFLLEGVSAALDQRLQSL